MKIGKLILVTLLVSAYATITVVHINMAQPKPVAEATLDMIEIMTRAFDESEGGDGGPSGGACKDLPIPHPYWAVNNIIFHEVFTDQKVVTVCGKSGWKFIDNLFSFEISWEGPIVSGHLSNCVSSEDNYCCQLDTGWFPNEAH